MAEPIDLGAFRDERASAAIDRLDRLKSGGPGGTSGGMDGWQTSVEARLGEIKGDIRDLRTSVVNTNAAVSTLTERVATLTERIAHLPSKGFVVTVVLTSLAVIAALVVFQGQIQTFLKVH